MFNLSGSEIVIILLLALIVLGPEKLPDAIRRFGRIYGELRRMGSGFQSEFKNAFDEPLKELRQTAQLTRDTVLNAVNDANPGAAVSTPEAGAESSAGGVSAAESPDESVADTSAGDEPGDH